MNKFFLFLIHFSLLLIYSCLSTPKLIREGKIVHQDRFVDDNNNDVVIKFMEKDLGIWFKDSCAIIETNRIFINTDFNNKETWYTDVEMYLYLDLKTKIFHSYKTFSDTATLLKRFTLPDTISAGWNFYGYLKSSNWNNELVQAPDTVIKKVVHKMFKGIKTFFDEDSIKRVGYLTYFVRQDKRNNLFHIDRLFDDKMKQNSTTRFDFSIPGKNLYTLSTKYEYVSEKLSLEEDKIFTKWAQNAKDTKLPISNKRE